MAKRYGKSDAGSETASTTKTTGGFFSKERIEARKKANKEKAKKRYSKLYPNSASANEKASVAKGKANAAATKKMRGTNADGSTRTQKEYEAARKKRQQAK